MGRLEKKVVMGDGAVWIWNLAEQYFPGAIQIVDLYHARQHLWELARKLHPNDEVKQKRWMMVQQRRLDGSVAKIVGRRNRAVSIPGHFIPRSRPGAH